MFMFFSNGQNPVLTGLLAGESANVIDKKREEFLINKAMNILQNIFGSVCPKKVFFNLNYFNLFYSIKILYFYFLIKKYL